MTIPIDYRPLCALLILALQGCGEGGGGQAQGKFSLPPASSGDSGFQSTHFAGSNNCVQCHDGITDEAGNDVSIVREWSASTMANATRDPFWKAKVRSELNRNPGLSEVINDKCSRCHAPMANVEADKQSEPITLFGEGFLNANHPRHDAAMEGVSCTLCHQIEDIPGLGTADGFSGHFSIASYDNSFEREIYGPYANITADPMINGAGFTPNYSAHIRESALCASCHNLKTPYVDANGTVLSDSYETEFPEQMVYSEWEFSDYAESQSCQQCHMSRTNGVVISSRPPWLATQRNDFARHDFIGANALLLDILDSNREQLGVVATGFAETIARSEAMLQGAASLAIGEGQLSAGTLGFNITVTSLTGHKLPSSYPSRRVVLQVRVRDGSGQVVFESGRLNEDGSITGVAADSDGNNYEPHHDLISDEGQVQVYEAIMGDSDNAVTYTLLRAARYLKDNRLLPAGFNKATAADDIKVVGNATTDSNFTAGGDTVRFAIAVEGNGPYTVEASLYYQSIAYGFLQDLAADESDEVSDFLAMYTASPYKGVTIATGTIQIN